MDTHHNVIRDLVAKGFLEPVKKGGLKSDGKSYNLFKLSRRWEKYGTTDFKPCSDYQDDIVDKDYKI